MSEFYNYLAEPHRFGLHLVAALVCVLAAYTAFSLAVKPAPAERIRYPWLIAAGVATGSGAWAANLIVLLGFQLGVPFAFKLVPTALALAIGILGSIFGLLIARRSDQMQAGGTIIGLAIAGMFYAGMMGVQFSAVKSWNSLYVVISVLLSASLGAAALARGHLTPDIRGRLLSTFLLAVGIMSVNLIGLTSLDLTPDPSMVVPQGTALPVLFGISLTAVIMLIIGLGVVGALVDRYVGEIETTNQRLEQSAAKLSEALKIGEAARSELVIAKDELEVRVAERTAELLEAKERAEKAARAKGEFLASMSHELRTPLNAILGFSDVISNAVMGPLSDRYRDYGADIHKSGQHLLSLVNDVLDLAKLESGRFTLREQIIDIAITLDACKAMVIGLANEARLRLSIQSAPGLPHIWADPMRIKQIVINLLSNAIKFTEPGGHVTVSAKRDNSGDVVIEVRDDGVGMRPQDIEQALQPFGQIDNHLNQKHDGTGLGLPMVKHLIDLHGGTLNIVSSAGAGTTVTLRLPARRAMRESIVS